MIDSVYRGTMSYYWFWDQVESRNLYFSVQPRDSIFGFVTIALKKDDVVIATDTVEGIRPIAIIEGLY